MKFEICKHLGLVFLVLLFLFGRWRTQVFFIYISLLNLWVVVAEWVRELDVLVFLRQDFFSLRQFFLGFSILFFIIVFLNLFKCVHDLFLVIVQIIFMFNFLALELSFLVTQNFVDPFELFGCLRVIIEVPSNKIENDTPKNDEDKKYHASGTAS